MSSRRLAAVLIACAALAAAYLATAQQPAEPPAGGKGAETAVPMKMAYPTVLPDSAGRALAERWCLLCHSAMLVTQQAKDSTAWEKTLAQMEKWGVTLTAAERDTMGSYLRKSFGPRPASPR